MGGDSGINLYFEKNIISSSIKPITVSLCLYYTGSSLSYLMRKANRNSQTLWVKADTLKESEFPDDHNKIYETRRETLRSRSLTQTCSNSFNVIFSNIF